MARLSALRPQIGCSGTLPRRTFLQAGLIGWGGLTLSDLLRLESQANAASSRRHKAMIMIWLWGGPSHLETFDLKPDAPSEYRGDFRPIETSVPGIRISEHLPRLAKLAEHFTIIRSCHHDSPGHVNATHAMLTGYPGIPEEVPPYEPKYPDFWSITHRALGETAPGRPARVALPSVLYEGTAWLGNGLKPLIVDRDPTAADFHVPGLELASVSRPQFEERLDLLGRLNRFPHSIDAASSMAALDTYQQSAVSLLTSDAVRTAFNLQSEDPQLRDRYGRNPVGQRCLLARRLVQAGVRIVSIQFPCVPGQKAFSWDDHASVWNIFEQMKIRLPVLDQVVSALIEDLLSHGLLDDVLVVTMGEMSHTPRLSNHEGQPGREHWARAMSLFLAGGGLPMGQVIGQTNARGEEPIDRPLTPNDVLATWYKYLGVPLDLQFNDRSGRPTPILPSGQPIRELV